MLKRFVVTICAMFALATTAWAGDLTRGLNVNGGRNASATLAFDRVNDPAGQAGALTIRVSLSHAKNLKGYGFSLQYDPAKYTFIEARAATGNLLAAGAGPRPLFLSSNRTPGQLDIGAVKVDGRGASGEGALVDLVFKTDAAPVAADFQVSESVLIGLDGNMDAPARVDVGDLKPLPDRFGLDRNMPNPFNPATVIGYQMPDAGRVRLTVYNLLGQEVRVLVDEQREAGSFTATWDGRDNLGRRVASGVYLYRMQAGDFTATKRMLLLK